MPKICPPKQRLTATSAPGTLQRVTRHAEIRQRLPVAQSHIQPLCHRSQQHRQRFRQDLRQKRQPRQRHGERHCQHPHPAKFPTHSVPSCSEARQCGKIGNNSGKISGKNGKITDIHKYGVSSRIAGYLLALRPACSQSAQADFVARSAPGRDFNRPLWSGKDFGNTSGNTSGNAFRRLIAESDTSHPPIG